MATEQNGKPAVRVLSCGTDARTAYPIVCTTTAIGLIERQLGINMGTFLGRIMSASANLHDMHTLLWACLEGARRRGEHPMHMQPWTLDEVGDLIDADGGPIHFFLKDNRREDLMDALVTNMLRKPPTPAAASPNEAATSSASMPSSPPPSTPASTSASTGTSPQ